MKKGCFISVILALTIIVAGVFYFVKNHGSDIVAYGTDKIVDYAQVKLFNEIDELQFSQYNDSLKIFVTNYFENIDTSNIEFELNKIEEISENIEAITIDKLIDSSEFSFIKKVLNKNE